MPTASKVCFFFETKEFSLENRQALKACIESLFKKERKPLDSLNYIFCTDKRLLEINRQFLKHDYYTDIITFDLSAGPATTGEIYISIDRVKDNARTLGTSIKSELHRVIFHGALHLCGYGDKKKEEVVVMRSKEDYWLSRYFSL
jgi:probable rRNA maturation factor